MKKKFALAMIAALALLTGCATASTGPDLKAIHYSGGSFSAKKFKGCLDPSSRSGYDPGDKYVAYPTRQVSYDATGGSGAESKAFKVVSKDNAELYVPVTVTFNLITDCDTLRKFHETLGARFNAGFDPDGTSSDTPDGWVSLLNYVIGKPLDTTLDRVAQNYTWRDVWNDPKVKTALEQEVNDNIDDLVARQAGGEFFDNFSVLVMKPDPVDPGLKQAIADEQAAVAQANAQTAKAKADKATAEAQERLARAEAKTKQAEIKGYGGIQNYLYAQCIENPSCGNPFRDQFLYGGAPSK
jgi:hypothetical protein